MPAETHYSGANARAAVDKLYETTRPRDAGAVKLVPRGPAFCATTPAKDLVCPYVFPNVIHAIVMFVEKWLSAKRTFKSAIYICARSGVSIQESPELLSAMKDTITRSSDFFFSFQIFAK